MISTGREPPEVSIIVPVFNEEERLAQNLQSLLGQRTAPGFEIIYIDDASTDGSWERLRELSGSTDCVRLYRLKTKHAIGTARRLAVKLAKGGIIANMDADCIAPPDWLSNWVLLNEETGVIGFPVIPPSDIEYLHWRFRYVGTGQYAPGSMPHGCGALIHKNLLLKVGNFPDVAVGEDTRLFRAIEQTGSRIVLLERPAIHLLQKRTTLGSHLKRYFERGRNAAAESRRLYAAAVGTLLAASLLAVLAWPLSPWISILLLSVDASLLANPRRVRLYVRSFDRPRHRTARIFCFGAIKMLETLAILSGFVVSLGVKREVNTSSDVDVILD